MRRDIAISRRILRSDDRPMCTRDPSLSLSLSLSFFPFSAAQLSLEIWNFTELTRILTLRSQSVKFLGKTIWNNGTRSLLSFLWQRNLVWRFELGKQLERSFSFYGKQTSSEWNYNYGIHIFPFISRHHSLLRSSVKVIEWNFSLTKWNKRKNGHIIIKKRILCILKSSRIEEEFFCTYRRYSRTFSTQFPIKSAR